MKNAMTDNHGYETPTKGATEWHESLNRNFRYIDRDIEIRDIDAAKTDYRPKSGAKFLATDTEDVYVGDGSQWLRLATSGENPMFDTVSAKTLVDRNSGSSYTVDQLAGGSGSGKSAADTIVTLEGGTPTAYTPDGSQLSQDSDAGVVFQAALDEVNANGGGSVFIGRGEFPVGQDVGVYSNTVVRGRGMGATVVKAATQAQWETAGSVSTLENVVFKDFTFDGQNQGGQTRMFFVGTPRNCHATRIQILNAGERTGNDTAGGIAFRGGTGCSYSQCHVDNTSYVSLSMQKTGGRNRIVNCLVTNPNNSGGFTHPISIESNTNSVMANNVVRGAGNPCLNANAVEGCAVVGNTVRNGIKGINVANGGNNNEPRQGSTIMGNVVQNMSDEGIRIQRSSTTEPPEENIVVGNLIREVETFGIYINNDARAYIANNYLARVGKDNARGIYVYQPGGPCWVINNVIWEPGNRGISYSAHTLSEFSDDWGVISGNYIYNPGYHPFENRQRCHIYDNTVLDTTRLSIVRGNGSFAHGNRSSGNIAVDGDNCVVVNNVASGMSDNGSGNVVERNHGYVTENSGSTSVADGDTIAHGLDETPTYVNLTPTVQGRKAAVSAVGSSNITVELEDSGGSIVGTAETVYWEAKAR